MLKMVGSSGQLSLGKKYAGQYFEIEQREDGVLILRPMKVIPESEAWLHEPEIQKKLRQAKEWMKKNPPAETGLDAFLEQVKDRHTHFAEVPGNHRARRGFHAFSGDPC